MGVVRDLLLGGKSLGQGLAAQSGGVFAGWDALLSRGRHSTG